MKKKKICPTKTDRQANLPVTENSRPPLPINQFLTLQEGSKLTGVPFDTLVSANKADRLEVIRLEPGIHTHTLWVHIGALASYMIDYAPAKYRWKPVRRAILALFRPSDANIRAVDSQEVSDLADKYRRGGPTPPVWTMKVDGVECLVDGQHRAHAMLEAGRDEIEVLLIDLPQHFVRAIAVYGNARHGRRLKGKELRQLVLDYLEENPEVRDDLFLGRIPMKAVADAVVVSVPTVSRALATLDPKPVVDAEKVFADLQRLLPHLGHAKPAEDVDMVAYFFHAALARYMATLTKQNKADLRRRIQLNTSPVCAAITPFIRHLVLRSGGARAKGKAMPPTAHLDIEGLNGGARHD